MTRSAVGSRSSRYSETFMRQNSCKTGQEVQSSQKTGSDGDARNVSGKLFEADAAAAGKARSIADGSPHGAWGHNTWN